MPSRYRRIQVIEHPELADALSAAAPYLPAGLSRSRQVRELAIAGARQLAGALQDAAERWELLDQLARRFEEPGDTGIDWDALRDSKRDACRSGST